MLIKFNNYIYEQLVSSNLILTSIFTNLMLNIVIVIIFHPVNFVLYIISDY